MPASALRGVYIPLITPFEADGSVAFDAVERLAHECLDAGAAGLVPLGTTGESPFLDADEKRSVIELCAAVGRERDVHVIVGVGTNSTPGTVAAAEGLAAVAGVTHALVVVPYYVRPSQAGIVAHMKAVAAASPVPLVLYNIPARTGRVLETAGMLELANTPEHRRREAVRRRGRHRHARAARRRAARLRRARRRRRVPPSLTYLGGAGAICASAHVCTERFVAMFECGVAGKVEEGRAHHEALLPVVQACFAEPNPAVFKARAARAGPDPHAGRALCSLAHRRRRRRRARDRGARAADHAARAAAEPERRRTTHA